MNQLYPIIRRKRRPLLVDAAPPVAVVNVEPVPPVPLLPVVEPIELPKPSDVKPSSKRKAK